MESVRFLITNFYVRNDHFKELGLLLVVLLAPVSISQVSDLLVLTRASLVSRLV
jgi:hypothetical protein